MKPIVLTPSWKRILDAGLALAGFAAGYAADPHVAILSAPAGAAIGAILSEIISDVNATGTVDPTTIITQSLQDPNVRAEIAKQFAPPETAKPAS